MNTKGKVEKLTEFFQIIGELYYPTGILLYALFLRISMMPKLVATYKDFSALLGCISLAQKRVANRFYYPCKFALFTVCPIFWLQGS